MTDDRFLHTMRGEPRPEFARDLHERLRAQGPAERPARGRSRRLAFSFASIAAVALIAVSFTLPAVRASAQAFLDLFRVRNFAAVSISPERIQELRAKKLDVESLIGDRTEAPAEMPKPQVVASLAEAGARAGFSVRTPAELGGLRPDTIAVMDGRTVSFRVHTAPLQQVLESLDIRDLQVPPGLDGQMVTVTATPFVEQHFVSERRRLDLVQARSPEVSLPAGTDLARLAEIALRIAGLDPGEARNFARSVDWHSTMLVPVPLDASSFTQVTVRGQKGLLVSYHGEKARQGPRHAGNLLLWGEGDMVYALAGNLGEVSLVQVAESLR
jgi:hypothetical protein